MPLKLILRENLSKEINCDFEEGTFYISTKYNDIEKGDYTPEWNNQELYDALIEADFKSIKNIELITLNGGYKCVTIEGNKNEILNECRKPTLLERIKSFFN